GYIEEASRSAESLRRHHPDVPICLITDQANVPAGAFTEIRAPRQPAEHKPIDKLLAYEAPYERCVFLDTDTRVFGDLTPLFAVLERFDVSAHQDINRGWHYDFPDVPLCFSEFNTGVIAFRRSAAVEEFFRAWRRAYDEINRTLGLVNDQPGFRRALYHSSLRVAPLPSEFHFLGNVSNAIMWKVRLIHARGDYDAIARQVDEQLGARAYIPDVGVLQSFRGRKHWFFRTLRMTARMIRLCFSPPRDSAKANPRKWWLAESAAAKLPPKRE
ncbi:MAG TPA: putative nucleotide-diphospho-sugar transferase, partial [Opitutaceae bacterium]|nr:putative nucleotide-diphospho-sugar transferase [Opitutaceae bacterium]